MDTQQDTPYSRWFKSNREKLNERRRLKYQQDPEYKARVLEKNRESRRVKRPELPPDQRSYTIGQAAKHVGRDVQTIRAWERRGYIPRVTDANGNRVYTLAQMDLLKELAEYMATYSEGERRTFQVGLQPVLHKLQAQWGA